jgi:hypothetical protein
MANILKKAVGQATIAGTSIYTVPAATIITIVGCRGSNKDNTTNHWVTFSIGGVLISAAETPLPVGSAIDIMEGSKIVAEAGDVITAFSDVDSLVDIYISYLEQT